jgi:hypothetical protein
MKDRKNAKERFVGIPHWVMRHPAFRAASHRARALLFDVVLQYNGSNNGKLVVCGKAMKPLCWNSNDGLYKAKNELLTLGLLTETRCGAKPSKAAWYALGWRPLDVKDGLDINPRSYVMLGARKIESGPPHGGAMNPKTAPCGGARGAPSTPPHGAVEGTFGPPSTPPHGAYIDCHTKRSTEGGKHG